MPESNDQRWLFFIMVWGSSHSQNPNTNHESNAMHSVDFLFFLFLGGSTL